MTTIVFYHRKPLILCIIATICSAFFYSCKPDEGLGGKAEITGKILLQRYCKADASLIDEIPFVDQDVYLVFGSDPSYGDKVKTSYDGTFMFRYLQPGDYTLYYFCDSILAGGELKNTVRTQKFSVSKGSENVNIGSFKAQKYLDVDDGTSVITGRVFLINYKNNFTEIKDTALAQEQELYLIYGTSKNFSIRIRTNYDGRFEFTGLVKGKYALFGYSENITGATEKIPVFRTAEINQEGQKVDVGDIYLIKK